jgi:hypothetical protein
MINSNYKLQTQQYISLIEFNYLTNISTKRRTLMRQKTKRKRMEQLTPEQLMDDLRSRTFKPGEAEMMEWDLLLAAPSEIARITVPEVVCLQMSAEAEPTDSDAAFDSIAS